MIWNVSVEKKGNHIFGYQVEADTILEAIKKVEHYGTVVRACLKEYEDD